MKARKILVAGALACSLALSSVVVPQVHAVEFADTIGLNSEASISKLVSLGVMQNPGDMFDPEGELTRAEFAFIVNKVMSLKAGSKAVKFSDLSQKDAAYSNAVKMVNNGFLAVDKAGAFDVDKGVTYAELSKALAQGLGLKSSWTNRSVDHLFYLVRKDVLDIDTDLDAVVTREEAAVAFDKYITLKELFVTDSGVISEVGEGYIVVNNGAENKKYTLASDVSIFIAGQGTTAQSFGIGVPVDLVLNKKGKVGFVSGLLLDAEEGALKLEAGKWKIGTAFTKEVNLNAYVASLPNNPTGPFSLTLFNQYQNAGAQFAGQAYFTDKEEVTALYPYIAKVENKPLSVKVVGNAVTVALSGTISESFELAEEVKITVNEKEATLQDLRNAQKAGDTITATIEANQNGSITVITAKTAPAKK